MRKIVLVTLLVTLASLCWGQSSSTGCLVVRNDKHHERVMSTGNVPFALRYSKKALKQFANEGINVIQIDKHERVNSDACVASNPVRVEPVAYGNKPVGYTLPERQTCIEMLTYHDGTVTCTKWSTPAR